MPTMATRHFHWKFKNRPKESAESTERNRVDDRDEGKAPPQPKKRVAETAVSRLRSALAAGAAGGHRKPAGLGARVTGTLYGHRRGHVHLAFQADSKSAPVVLVELATPTSALVREMASGLVRIALECERRRLGEKSTPGAGRLVEEPLWRAYVNGKKCGYAVRRECGPADWKVLQAVQPVSMGAGVIPGDGAGAGDRDVMYMRARFERVVGSKDSEAFYMMNPDGSGGGGGGPELSVYFLRV